MKDMSSLLLITLAFLIIGFSSQISGMEEQVEKEPLSAMEHYHRYIAPRGENNEAVRFWSNSPPQNESQAQYKLGYIYLYGEGVDLNLTQAEYWLKKYKGYFASTLLGLLDKKKKEIKKLEGISSKEATSHKYTETEPLPTNLSLSPFSEKIYREENHQNDETILPWRGEFKRQQIPCPFTEKESYERGIRFYNNQDYSVAKTLFEHAAAAKKKQPVAYECPHALYMLGVINLLGQGGDKNVGEAIFYFKEYGKTIQRCEHLKYIGGETLYDEGIKLYNDKDYTGAIVLFEQAVTQSCRDAFYMLGIMNLLGEGVNKNEEQGEYYLNSYFKSGNQDAGPKQSYDTGIKRYINKEYLEAKILFGIAAKYKNTDALFMLGIYHHYGFAGVTPSYDMAIEYYTAAAAQTMLSRKITWRLSKTYKHTTQLISSPHTSHSHRSLILENETKP